MDNIIKYTRHVYGWYYLDSGNANNNIITGSISWTTKCYAQVELHFNLGFLLGYR